MGSLRPGWFCATAFLVLLLALLTVAAAADLGGVRSLISSGGGHVSLDGVAMQSAAGQPLVGWSRSGVSLCSGFLCGPGLPEHKVFLPAVTRHAGRYRMGRSLPCPRLCR
jgi:hypothetical protein